ncbi:MAG: DNA photolyase family protein [Anaerolineae bacterium]|nr:DNA photolyase family protein [Anaerolineae bacterium]
MTNPVICWLRRDLRLHDHTALSYALTSGQPVIVTFIFDPAILKSPRIAPARVKWMLQALHALDQSLREHGSRLVIREGDPTESLLRLCSESGATRVFFNCDYTPFSRKRDARVTERLQANGITVESCHDRVLVPPDQIENNTGKPYTVYSPYKKKWRETQKATQTLVYDLSGVYRSDQFSIATPDIPSLEALGFSDPQVPLPIASETAALDRLHTFMQAKIYRYHVDRNLIANPDDEQVGVSFMSPYIRFGLVSLRQIRAAAAEAYQATHDEKQRDSVTHYMDEIVWHEFYNYVLWHFPHVYRTDFNPKFEKVPFRYVESEVAAWKAGLTGYPIVDASMRQMQALGWMHNRARMIVASFLTKDLLCYWSYGELHFMQHLLDGDIAQNNGGWQWAAGTGTDAAPYFRIFNPITQSEKFDPDGRFIRYWIPELRDVPNEAIHAPWKLTTPPKAYPAPIVDHQMARNRALTAFGEMKGLF